MATKKFSALTTGTTANATDKIPIERSGANFYITPAMLSTYIGGGGGSALVAVARNTTGLLVNSATTTRIDFDTVDYDPGSDITVGASWVYTVPTTAWYDVRITQALINRNGLAWVAGGYARIDVYNGASALATIGFEAVESIAATGFVLNVSGGRAFSCTAGDTINLRFSNQTGNQRELESECAVEIFKVT